MNESWCPLGSFCKFQRMAKAVSTVLFLDAQTYIDWDCMDLNLEKHILWCIVWSLFLRDNFGVAFYLLHFSNINFCSSIAWALAEPPTVISCYDFLGDALWSFKGFICWQVARQKNGITNGTAGGDLPDDFSTRYLVGQFSHFRVGRCERYTSV